MSINTKYKLPFKSVKKNEYELRLKTEGYTGNVHTLKGTGSPVTIENPQKSKTKFEPIKGREMIADLWVERNTANYDFLGDFEETTSRKWLAELVKKTEGAKTGECSIDVLNLTASGSDAVGSIEVTNKGHEGYVNQVHCIMEMSGQVTLADGESFRTVYYACPPGGDPNSSESIRLFTQDYVADGGATGYETISGYDIAALIDSKKDYGDVLVTDESENQADYGYRKPRIKVNITTYLEIYSNWNIQMTCSIQDSSSGNDEFYQVYDNYTFSDKVRRDKIIVRWLEKSTSTSPYVTDIAEREANLSGDTTADAALELKNEIDGTVLNDVYFPTDDVYKNVTLLAEIDSINSSKVNITLSGIGGTGNNVDIINSILNDTALYVIVPDYVNSTYAVTVTNFSGANDDGDTFTIYTKNTSSIETQLAQVIGYAGETKAQIMQKLINYVNENYEDYEAEETANDDTLKLNSFVDDDDQFKFVTSGGSTVSPNIYTDYQGGQREIKKFIGWVSPDYYSRKDFTNDLFNVELTAFDALGDLKNFIFEIDGKRPFEKKSIIEIVTWALRQTGLNLKLYESFNLWEENMDDSISPLLQTYIPTLKYNGKSAYDVLTEICRTFWMILRQVDGHWELIQIDRQNENYSRRVFDQFGAKIADVARQGHIKDAGNKNNPNIYINKSAEYNYHEPFKRVNLSLNFGLIPQLVKFPTFIGINDNLTAALYPWTVIDSNRNPVGTGADNFIKTDEYLEIIEGSNRLSQLVEFADYPVQDGFAYELEIIVRKKQNETFADSFDIQLYVNNDDEYWFFLNSSGNLQPTYVSPENITINVEDGDGDQSVKLPFNYPSGVYTFLQKNNINLQIFQPSSGKLQLKSLKIYLKKTSLSGISKTVYYSELVNKIAASEYNQTITLGDVPKIPLAESIYKNGLFWFDSSANNYKLTSLWVDNISTPTIQTKLVDYLRNLYLEEYHRPAALLSADIYGDIAHADILRETTTDNKLMMCIGGTWNVKNDIMEGEFQEIGLENTTDTLVTEQKHDEADSSGTNTYTGEPGGESDVEVDLSDYLRSSEIISLIEGNTIIFTGSDLTNHEINITHDLGREPVMVTLIQDGKRINPSNYEWNSENSTNYIVLTLNYPLGDSEQIKARIL